MRIIAIASCISTASSAYAGPIGTLLAAATAGYAQYSSARPDDGKNDGKDNAGIDDEAQGKYHPAI